MAEITGYLNGDFGISWFFGLYIQYNSTFVPKVSKMFPSAPRIGYISKVAE